MRWPALRAVEPDRYTRVPTGPGPPARQPDRREDRGGNATDFPARSYRGRSGRPARRRRNRSRGAGGRPACRPSASPPGSPSARAPRGTQPNPRTELLPARLVLHLAGVGVLALGDEIGVPTQAEVLLLGYALQRLLG